MDADQFSVEAATGRVARAVDELASMAHGSTELSRGLGKQLVDAIGELVDAKVRVALVRAFGENPPSDPPKENP